MRYFYTVLSDYAFPLAAVATKFALYSRQGLQHYTQLIKLSVSQFILAAYCRCAN